MQLLLLADIHGNYPALAAVDRFFRPSTFARIINCGDSVVYGPCPNETLHWLAARQTLSILGNTDKKVLKLLAGESFAKPSKAEKRVMYTWTAAQLSADNSRYLRSLPKRSALALEADDGRVIEIGIYHGSPARNHEFLFHHTPEDRFRRLARLSGRQIIVCGHSHDPFHQVVDGCHFINPGSVGRMFDSDPRASCAVLHLDRAAIAVEHYRIDYDVEETVAALRRAALPEIYAHMFRHGEKTN